MSAPEELEEPNLLQPPRYKTELSIQKKDDITTDANSASDNQNSVVERVQVPEDYKSPQLSKLMDMISEIKIALDCSKIYNPPCNTCLNSIIIQLIPIRQLNT